MEQWMSIKIPKGTNRMETQVEKVNTGTEVSASAMNATIFQSDSIYWDFC